MATETSGYSRIAESFQLAWSASTRTWRGASAETGPNLQLIVEPLAEPDHYDIHLNTRDGDDVLASITWPDLDIGPGPPWDSGLLTTLPPPGNGQFETHVFN